MVAGAPAAAAAAAGAGIDEALKQRVQDALRALKKDKREKRGRWVGGWEVKQVCCALGARQVLAFRLCMQMLVTSGSNVGLSSCHCASLCPATDQLPLLLPACSKKRKKEKKEKRGKEKSRKHKKDSKERRRKEERRRRSGGSSGSSSSGGSSSDSD